MVAPGVRLSRGTLRFRAAHRSLWSRPSHPLRISAATQRLSGNSPAAGQAAPENGAASPYRCPPPAPAAALHRGYGAFRSLPLSRWSFHRSLWALRPDAAPRPALYPPAYSRFCDAAAPPPTGRPASRWSASHPYRSPLLRPASPWSASLSPPATSCQEPTETPPAGQPASRWSASRPYRNPPLRPTSFRAKRPDCAPSLRLPAARPSIRPASFHLAPVASSSGGSSGSTRRHRSPAEPLPLVGFSLPTQVKQQFRR